MGIAVGGMLRHFRLAADNDKSAVFRGVFIGNNNRVPDVVSLSVKGILVDAPNGVAHRYDEQSDGPDR